MIESCKVVIIDGEHFSGILRDLEVIRKSAGIASLDIAVDHFKLWDFMAELTIAVKDKDHVNTIMQLTHLHTRKQLADDLAWLMGHSKFKDDDSDILDSLYWCLMDSIGP